MTTFKREKTSNNCQFQQLVILQTRLFVKSPQAVK